MVTQFIAISDKANSPFVNVQLYRILKKMLFVRNIIDTDEEIKTVVAGQCVPMYVLTSFCNYGTKSPVFALFFHDLYRMNAQWLSNLV